MTKPNLEEIAKKFNKSHPDALVTIPGSDKNPVVKLDTIPTGSPTLDAAIGIGGYPRGRVVEMFGPESGGKSTLALHAVAEAQKLGLWALYLDFEHALDLDYAQRLGVDLGMMILSQPDNGEDGFRVIDNILKDSKTYEGLGIIVVDSVAAIQTKAQLGGEIGDAGIGQVARLIGGANRTLVPRVAAANVCLLYINQVRANVGVMYGPSETTPGGNSIKFAASVRMRIAKGQKIEKGGSVYAQEVRVDLIKNKVGKPYTRAELRLILGKGIDRATEVVNELVRRGEIKKAASWFKLPDGSVLGQGAEQVYELHGPKLEDMLAASVPVAVEVIEDMEEDDFPD